MPRIRYLKPDFFTDEDLAELTFETRIAFAGLWCHADKAGRLEDRPKYLKAMIFPYDKVDMEKQLGILSKPKKSGFPFIQRYSIECRQYIQILTWSSHQKPHSTEKESIIPPAPPLNTKGNGKGNGEGVKTSSELSNGEITVKEPLKENSTRFIPPTIEEVSLYCKERKNSVNPESWMNHYQSNGWMVGKNKMKDWRAAVRTWEKKEESQFL